MSREIKFRAWNEKTRRFTKDSYNAYLSRNNNGIITEQYTGLKDKNGKEIYEGDIVNAIGKGIAQVINSPSGEWMLYYIPEPNEIKSSFASVVPKNKPTGLWKTNTNSYIEVIGNIHENADLLGGNKDE